MFEEGNRLRKIYGAENVYDFSLGNPNIPAPKEVNEAILKIIKEEDSCFVHGYMSNGGYEDVREKIAENINKKLLDLDMQHVVYAAVKIEIIKKSEITEDKESEINE